MLSLQVAELAEWALGEIPATQHGQQAQHAAQHVLELLHTAFRALACTHEAVLGEVLRLTRDIFEEPGKSGRRSGPNSKFRGALWSEDLSDHVESLT